MSELKYSIVLFFAVKSVFCQVFIPVDYDTNEFIENVSYSLFNKNKIVFKGVTANNELTKIKDDIEFDSIAIARIDYNTIGLQKKKIDSILYLTKKIVYLNEVVVTSKKDNNLIFGETNRFVKKQSRPITEELIFGVVFKNELNKKIKLNKIAFFTEKIIYKTAYKVNFYEVNETVPKNGNQFADIGNLIFSSDTLYIDKKSNDKNEIDIDSKIVLQPNQPVFVSIQLINYVDDNNNKVLPINEYKTKLKFQLSNKTNFYSRTINLISKEMSSDFLNINLQINYDFANQFYKKPHKSILVTPAIIMYGKEDEKS